jgi:hypothetical protein
MSENTVVIGGGTLGLLLAQLLVDKGRKVVIIESGKINSFDSFEDKEFLNIGKKHAGISIGRAKGLGGTSNLWGGQLALFTPKDFDSKGVFDQPDWPIFWKEIEPYYDKVFNYFGFNESTSEDVLCLNEKSKIERIYTFWLKQPNFKSLFYEKLKRSGLVTIHERATVNSLIFEKQKCIGISLSGNNSLTINNISNVILANGTIEINRLLLQCKQNPNCPFESNEIIGKYFQDHLNFVVATIKKPTKNFFDIFCNKIIDGQKVQPKLRIESSASENYIGVSGYFSFSSDISHNLDNFKQFAKAIMGRSSQKMTLIEFLELTFKTIKILPKITPIVYKYIVQNKIYIPFNSTVNLIIQSQQISIRESQILLDEGNDNNNQKRVLLDWKIDGREFTEIEKFCFALKEYLEENNLGKVEFVDWFNDEIQNRSNNWKNNVSDIYHHSGGAIMGNNKLNSVVDIDCKIHQTDNLYVCGAAVMPTSSYANTGLTAMALALKMSDKL